MAIESLPYGEVLKTEEEVREGIAQQAERVIDFYSLDSKVGQKVLFVTLLNGGVPHAHMLMAEITKQAPHAHPDLQYIKISRYGKAQTASNVAAADDRIRLNPEYQALVSSYDAIGLLDDIADDGRSLDIAYDEMKEYEAGEIDAWLLGKKAKETPVGAMARFRNIDVVFPNLPDIWLTGMGLDDTGLAPEANRHLQLIAEGATQDQGITREEVVTRLDIYRDLPPELKRYAA